MKGPPNTLQLEKRAILALKSGRQQGCVKAPEPTFFSVFHIFPSLWTNPMKAS
jgi:hypothetical protein